MYRMFQLFIVSILLIQSMAVAAAEYQHPHCTDMQFYQAPYVATSYDINRHMGHYYEVAFRDLYLPPPQCDCQHTYKILDDAEKQNYHEDFEFKCKNLGRMTSIIGLDSVASKVNPAVFNQTIEWSYPEPPIPFDAIFQTATIAFKEIENQDQYEWVVEFTCGTTPEDFMSNAFPGGFVGLNFYSKSGPTNESNLQDMKDAVSALGLDWVMEDWGWGFHEVPHAMDCEYNSPDEKEYTCNADTNQCEVVQWGLGTRLDDCVADC